VLTKSSKKLSACGGFPSVRRFVFGCDVLLVVAAAILCGSCNRHVRVTREMAWECVPAERDPAYPDAEPVMFRYAEDPGYFDLASGRGLCQQLRSSGKGTVKVTYDAWGSLFRGLHGYRIELINGQPLQDIGGPARSGYHGTANPGPHPLARALQ
jgi:hypothetical protein